MPQRRLAPVPFVEAIEWADGRRVVLPDEFYGELQGFARAQAFSIAGITGADQLQAALDSLAEHMVKGIGFAEWKRRVTTGKIGLELPDWRLENIYRTNTQSHYNRGRCVQQGRSARLRPYLLYDAVDDDRTRPAHAAMDGYVALIDDPIWKEWYPPNGYQCRCTCRAITEEQAGEYRAKWDERMRSDKKVEDLGDKTPMQAFIDAATGGPDAGWNYHPCADADAVIDQIIEGRARKLVPDLSRALLSREEANPRAHQFFGSAQINSGDATLEKVKALGRKQLDELLDFALPDDKEAVASIKLRLKKISELIDTVRAERGETIVDLQIATRALRDEIQAKLRKVRSVGGAKIATWNKSGKGFDEMRRLSEKLPDSWVAAGNATKVQVNMVSGRAFYFQEWHGEKAKIKTRGPGTTEHEYTHHLQYVIPGFDKLFQVEHKARTAGEALREIYPGENGRTDKYVDKYQGREYESSLYGDDNALEVVTVAFQALLGGSEYEDALLANMLVDDQSMLELALGVLFHFRP